MTEETVTQQEESTAPPAAPVPFVVGTFAIYDDGRGGFVAVADVKDHGVQRFAVSAGILKMIDRLGSFGPGRQLRSMLMGLPRGE